MVQCLGKEKKIDLLLDSLLSELLWVGPRYSLHQHYFCLPELLSHSSRPCPFAGSNDLVRSQPRSTRLRRQRLWLLLALAAAFTRHAISSDTRPLIRVVTHRLLQCSSGGCAKSDDWQASTSVECCSSCDHRHTQVRPRTVADTAHWTALAQRAWASHVQALHHGVQLPTGSGAAVLGRPLPTSLRRCFSAASQVRQSTTPGPSATPVANVWLTGFLFFWPVGLELIAWQSKRFER